jgi:hypothetical protein
MIIHLDSNFRNRSLYPNPSSYAIEINGTPPANVFIKDGRGCFLTDNQVIFSFYFFNKSRSIPYTSYSNNSIVIDIEKVPHLQTYLQVYSTISQNYFVGYIVQDQVTLSSSTIRLSYRVGTQFTLILENSITKAITGTLKLINPSLTLGNNLLINGYSIFNQIPNVGYYFNDGINNFSILFNLTKGLETNILTVDKPYRNVTFNPQSKNSQQPFTVDKGDYIIVLNNRQEKDRITNLSFQVLDLFPVGLKDYTIVSKNFTAQDVQVGDLFESQYGDNVGSVFPKNKDYFVITKASLLAAGPKKMILRVSKILLEEIVFVIDNPGNDIERYQQYTFQKIGDPSKTLIVRSTGVSFSVKVTQDAQFLDHKNFMVYFINFFVAVPFYTVITGVESFIIFLENPPFLQLTDIFINSESQLIYDRIGCIQYFSFFPNLVMPLSNTPQSCYQVRLSSITLPNLPLCGTKFLLADFPYILVTFGNLTSTNIDGRSSTNNSGSIWSNNPKANSATFMCAIANIRSPDIIKYVVIRSAQVVSMKLNLGENLRFSVYLPNGTLIRYSRRFEINPQQQSFTPSLSCTDDMSLTTSDPENTSAHTQVYSYIDELSITATFILNQLY